MEVFHIRKYGRFSLSEIRLFLELEAVPGTDTGVPDTGDPKRGKRQTGPQNPGDWSRPWSAARDRSRKEESSSRGTPPNSKTEPMGYITKVQATSDPGQPSMKKWYDHRKTKRKQRAARELDSGQLPSGRIKNSRLIKASRSRTHRKSLTGLDGAGVGVMNQVPGFAAFHVWRSRGPRCALGCTWVLGIGMFRLMLPAQDPDLRVPDKGTLRVPARRNPEFGP
ncbi:hypothetical protein F2Q70_00043608 [Brassica cretica]|uniref:Uncharacterized protein n=1 Tax=Brassica cretica TaxID=69181 RepID=A0A8S9KKM6_BRACR|nr:hypothetical protein F2Q70_00043608 [Brassica cretica]